MSHPAAADDSPCPCGSPLPYGRCCGRWHGGPLHLQAPSAEALMRSRYCAYVLGLDGYLLDTWHPGTRPASLPAVEAGLRWLGLQVRSHQSQGTDAATVSFVARSKLGGRAHRMQETSRFLREGGRWYYLDGDVS